MMVHSDWDEFARRQRRREGLLLLLAGLFVLVNFTSLGLARAGSLEWAQYGPALFWAALVALCYALLARFRPAHDPLLLPLVAFLSGWGLVLVDRLVPQYLNRQMVWLALGLGAMVAVAVLPANLRFLSQFRYTWLSAGLLLVGATLLFGVNPSGFGARLWLRLPFAGNVYFQPSELLKLLLVVFLASYFEGREQLLQLGQAPARALPYLAPLLLMWGFCLTLLFWQRDLGAATLFFLLFLALLYLATGERRYVAGGLGLLALAGIFAYFAYDVVALRVDAWWNPWPEATGRAYQIVQSLYALASGGLWGQGLLQGFPEYVPVIHSDFVFAAIGEEWGLAGSLGVVACFALLAHRGLRIAMLAERSFYLYLAAGIAILFATQALLIMGGVARVLPLTGVTLPFVSYGGSSLLVSSLMAGLLLYLSAQTGGQKGALPAR